MKPTIDLMYPVQMGELLSAMPADGDQQVDRQRLIHDVRELEVDPQNGDKKTEVEEQQQWLEQVVPEVVPELRRIDFDSSFAAATMLASSTVTLLAVNESTTDT